MRHPVSTPCCDGRQGGAMACDIVGGAIVPHAPQYAGPSARQDADGVRMIATARACFGINLGCPLRSVARVVGETGKGATQAMVAGPAERDAATLPRLVSQRCHTGFGGQLRIAGEAVAYIAQFGEDLCGADLAGTRQRHDELTVGQLGYGVLDTRGELGDLFDDDVQGSGERVHERALGIGFRFIGMTTGRGKDSTSKRPNRSLKEVLGYPLTPRFRELLEGRA